VGGYQLFWATYSFSGYLQNHFGMTAVTVGSITVAKLWMRPIGAISAGFFGDRLNPRPLINGYLLERFPGQLGYSIYFSGISSMGLLGALAAWRLMKLVEKSG
jgi:hypothetical protein